MRISNRTIYAVAGIAALLTISMRLQSATNASTNPATALTEVRSEPPATNYTPLSRSQAGRRAESEVAERAIPVAELPDSPDGTTGEGKRAQKIVANDPSTTDDTSVANSPAIRSDAADFDADGTLAQRTQGQRDDQEPDPSDTNPPVAQAGDLSDQAVYELFVSSLDDENRREFRATWGLMGPDERQGWLEEARAALANP